MMGAPSRSVVVVGLGAIGTKVAKILDENEIEGLHLAAVCDRSQERGRRTTAAFRRPLTMAAFADIGSYDIIVEAASARVLPAIIDAAVFAGRILVPCSVGALLEIDDIAERIRSTGARIVVPSGALGGLDAVRAAMEGIITSVSLETRKAPANLAGAPFVVENNINLDVSERVCIFDGSAREAARGFPANINVAAALALAGVGPDATRVQIIADPAATHNVHTIRIVSDAVCMTLQLEGVPSAENPKTSSLTPYSVVAALRGLMAPLKIGT